MSQRTSASRRTSTWPSRLHGMDGAVNRALGYTTIAIVMFSIGCSPDRALHGYNLGAAYEDIAPGLICQRGFSTVNKRWDGLLQYPSDSTAAELRYCEPVPKSDSNFSPHEDNDFLLVFDDNRLVEMEGIARFDAGTHPSDAVIIPPPETWRAMLQHLTDAFGGPPDSISQFSCHRLSTDESLCLADFRLYWPPSKSAGQLRNFRSGWGAPTFREAVVYLRASPRVSRGGSDLVLSSYERVVRCWPQGCAQRRLSALAARTLDYLLERIDSARAASDSVPP